MCDRRYQKSVINSYTNSTQNVVDNGTILFNNKRVDTGCSICHSAGTATFELKKQGTYLVLFSANVSATAAAGGTLNLQLYNNGVIEAGANAQHTVANSTDIVNLSFPATIHVMDSCNCINNDASLTVRNITGQEIVLNNVTMVVVKLA